MTIRRPFTAIGTGPGSLANRGSTSASERPPSVAAIAKTGTLHIEVHSAPRLPVSSPRVFALWITALSMLAPAAGSFEVTEQREPCASHNPLRSAHFGDLHVHTAFSHDASTQGTRNTPRDAYRFARGEPLGIQPYDGDEPLRTLQLARPLDFAAVTDHAELLGEVQTCSTQGLPGYDSIPCWIYREWPRVSFFMMNAKSAAQNPTRFDFCGPDGIYCTEASLTPWREIRAAAEGAYDRSAACRFTTFVAYEWTGSINTNNLHRNVIFRNERVPEHPASYYETPSAELLWQALDRECLGAGSGCDVLVIPHNSNISNGLMWPTQRSDGTPITAADARVRAAMEPVAEIMQHKGDSECRLGPATRDELCAFEKLSYQNFIGKFFKPLAEDPHPRSYLRRALQDGLREEERIGVNPFKLGLIASTDTHLGSPGMVAEDTHPGHGGAGASATQELPRGLPDDLEYNPGGLAGIWAEENSRDSLFAALRRREVFGTSGPRIAVRFFGGWDYAADLCGDTSFLATGYARGVAMGGDLPPRPEASPDAAPVFAVMALRDPGPPGRPGTPLQRLQIVKGWIDGGEPREAIYDVAGNAANGATVDVSTCERRGSGAGALCAVWRDPAFDAGQRAFYYARAVENPSCRWSSYVCNAAGVDCDHPAEVPDELEVCCDPDHRRTIQERAWSSPIWYSPAAPTSAVPSDSADSAGSAGGAGTAS